MYIETPAIIIEEYSTIIKNVELSESIKEIKYDKNIFKKKYIDTSLLTILKNIDQKKLRESSSRKGFYLKELKKIASDLGIDTMAKKTELKNSIIEILNNEGLLDKNLFGEILVNKTNK
jgi:hypothetical protein